MFRRLWSQPEDKISARTAGAADDRPPGNGVDPRATSAGVALVALLIFALAYYSPISNAHADPAIALLAAQALIDHHTIRLDAYADGEDLAYDITTDYRVRSYDGNHYPNSLGVPILSVPAVWTANRLGFDMRDQLAEFATQNVLSALSCALLFVLWFRLCRLYLGVGASLTVAAISMLGSSAMSTGATGLWNSNYALLFTSLALLHLARRDRGAIPDLNLVYLGALVVVGFISRPSTAFFAVALLAYLLGEAKRWVALGAGAALVGTTLAVVLPALVPLPWMAAHYAPARLQFNQPLAVGLYGVLLSPSRGLAVFSPFLCVVAAAAAVQLRSLWADRLFRLCSLWILVHTLAVATNAGRWWGGHSFGPRMLIDLMPGFVVLTCILFHGLVTRSPGAAGRWKSAYLVLGLAAVAVHTGQGLFNRATQEWNVHPNVDSDPALTLDWRYPQFLATYASLETRLDDYERRQVEERRDLLPAYAPGNALVFDADEVIFVHWYAAEDGWRWTRGEQASLILRLPERDTAGRLFVLEIVAGSIGTQHVDVLINGTAAGGFGISGLDPVTRKVPVPGELLRPGAANTVALRVSDPRSPAGDRRQLGVALRELRLVALAAESVEVTFADDSFFAAGFSPAEVGWRWTDGEAAKLSYPMGEVSGEREYELAIVARALGEQRVRLAVNGATIGNLAVGAEFVAVRQRFSGALLLPHRLNEISFELPDALAPPGDPRRLGLAVVSVSIASVPAAGS